MPLYCSQESQEFALALGRGRSGELKQVWNGLPPLRGQERRRAFLDRQNANATVSGHLMVASQVIGFQFTGQFASWGKIRALDNHHFSGTQACAVGMGLESVDLDRWLAGSPRISFFEAIGMAYEQIRERSEPCAFAAVSTSGEWAIALSGNAFDFILVSAADDVILPLK